MLGGHLVLGWTLQGLHSYPLNDLSAFSLSQPVTWLVGSPPWGYQKREAQSPPPVLERICFISPLNQWTPTNAISRAPRRLQGWPADCLWKDLFTDKGGKNVLNSLRAKLATEAFREMLYGPIFFYRNYTQKYLVVVVESMGGMWCHDSCMFHVFVLPLESHLDYQPLFWPLWWLSLLLGTAITGAGSLSSWDFFSCTPYLPNGLKCATLTPRHSQQWQQWGTSVPWVWDWCKSWLQALHATKPSKQLGNGH